MISISEDLSRLSDPVRAKFCTRFFKTGPGEYAEGDIFLGITVPSLRKLAKKYFSLLKISQITNLLHSKFHEERLLALILMCKHFAKGDASTQEKIYKLYLKNTKYINNWDLVDTSAPYIVGSFLLNRSRDILYTFAKSKSLWERRIAIIATFAFIRQGESGDTLALSEILLYDTHDLIQKAVGWMLREVGKQVSLKDEQAFLQKYAATMPRTTLRYAIERFPKELRNYFLLKKSKEIQIYG